MGCASVGVALLLTRVKNDGYDNKMVVQKQKKNDVGDRLRKKLAIKTGPKKLCLVSIVKNESKNMKRILDSVKSIVDMISIVDTGSNDNTKEVIIDWGKTNKIPTAVHDEPFKNFSHNRTHSVKAAKQAFPEADYFLLSDADFVWDINRNGMFDKILLIDHKYLVEQYNKSLSYWNIRILSAKVDWECVGVTHEYWVESKTQTSFNGYVRVSKVNTIAIDDREDGGAKSDKYERDERLLREGLLDPATPNDLKTRYKFYLAQTLKDVGKFEESIEFYKKRIDDKGWVEEVYYAKFQIGFNYEQLGWRVKNLISLIAKKEKTEQDLEYMVKWNPKSLQPHELVTTSNQHFVDAAIYYMAAYNYRKVRAEALYYCTRMYRMLSMNQMAYDLAIMGNKIKYPDQDTLFIEKGCYLYNFDFELSIVAFYTGNKEVGREAVARLLQRTDIPSWMMPQIEVNSRHYI